MEQTTYETWGTCSKFINFEIDDDHIIHNVHFIGGCSGNTQGVSANQRHVQTNLRKLLKRSSTDV